MRQRHAAYAAKYDATDAIQYLSARIFPKAADIKATFLFRVHIGGAARQTELLISSGSPVNNQNYSGETALHQSGKNNNAAIVRLLTANGHRPKSRIAADSPHWRPPLHTEHMMPQPTC
jgi:ankyrin repeat protein